MITTITHIGNGKFSVVMDDGSIKESGKNLNGIIRYTYFEDYCIPEIGWQVSHKKLMEDYLPKVHKDILDGKIKIS